MILDITNEDNLNLIEEYIDIIIKTGVNLQLNQPVVLKGPLETADFMRLIAKKCYQLGSGYVMVEYIDSLLDKEKFKYASNDVISYFPKWKADGLEELCKNNACFIRISGEDPDIFEDIPSDILALYNKTNSKGMKNINKYIINSELSWVVAAAPTKSWAKKVFPNLSEFDAVNKLWANILYASRISAKNSFDAWKNHNELLSSKSEFLNKMQFAKLQYKSAKTESTIGTDLIIELPKNHIWSGGSELNKSGIVFNPNIPTEEVFTAPYKYGINGFVSSTLPFNFNGNLIEDFELFFENGKIVKINAKKGYDILKSLLSTDEGASYIGEVALVPYDSPISNLNTIFYNTLFDENASCHLAFGSAYPTCVKDGEHMSDNELEEIGLNTSLIHYDFMIGSKELEIIGFTESGNSMSIFKNGKWAF